MTSGQRTSREAVHLINVERVKVGLKPLRASRLLRLTARAYAVKLARSGRFEHGQTIEGPHEFLWLGECLARGQRAPASVVRSWIESAPHKAILLSEKARWMGFAVAGRSGDRPTWVLHAGRR